MSDNPFYNMPLGLLNALMATVMGDEEQSRLAKEYLKETDPTWGE